MKLDKESLSNTYRSVPDDEIESYVLNNISDFTHEALGALKNEVERRNLSPDLEERIEFQLTKGIQPSHKKILLRSWLFPLICFLLAFARMPRAEARG
jgi:hypothetical protein